MSPYIAPGLDKISIDMILEHVSKVYGYPVKTILKPSRRRIFTEPRQIAVYLTRKRIKIKEKPISRNKIGAKFGMDNATVIYSENTIVNLIGSDIKVKGRYDRIVNMLPPDNINYASR